MKRIYFVLTLPLLALAADLVQAQSQGCFGGSSPFSRPAVAPYQPMPRPAAVFYQAPKANVPLVKTQDPGPAPNGYVSQGAFNELSKRVDFLQALLLRNDPLLPQLGAPYRGYSPFPPSQQPAPVAPPAPIATRPGGVVIPAPSTEVPIRIHPQPQIVPPLQELSPSPAAPNPMPPPTTNGPSVVPHVTPPVAQARPGSPVQYSSRPVVLQAVPVYYRPATPAQPKR